MMADGERGVDCGQQSHDRLNVLYETLCLLNQMICRAQSQDELLAETCRILVECGGFRMVWVGFCDPATLNVSVAAKAGDTLGYLDTVEISAADCPTGQGPMGTAIREERTCVCNDFLTDPGTLPWRAAAARCGWHSSIAVPIRMAGKVRGALTVYSEQVGFFVPRYIAMLERSAEDLSYALDQLELRARTLRDTENLRFNQFAIDHMADSAFWVKESGEIDYANEAATRMLGWTTEELRGLRVYELDNSYAFDRWKPHWEQLKSVGSMVFESVLQRRTGEKFPVQICANYMAFGGKEYNCAFLRDISGLRRLETQYGLLFREMINGFALHELVCDADGNPADYRFLAVNPAFERMTGLKADEIIGKTALEVIPNLEPHWLQNYAHVVETREAISFVSESAALDRIFEVEAYSPEPGKFACIFADITVRVRAERELKKALAEVQLLRQAMDSVSANVFMKDTDLRYIYANRTALERLGSSAAELRGTDDTRYLAPDALQRVREADRKVLQGEKISQEIVLEWSTGQRTVHWTTKTPFYSDPDRKVVAGLLGISTDITARKEAEGKLLETAQRLQLALSTAELGVFEYDVKSDRLTWDDRMLEIYGIDRASFVPRSNQWMDLLHPEDRAVAISASEAAVNEEKMYTLEFRILRPDGEARNIYSTGIYLRDAQGAPVRLIGLNRDVTEQKRAEAALRESERRFARTLAALNDGLWEWNIVEGTGFFSPSYYAMLGYERNEFPATYAVWRDLIHPEDVARVERELALHEAQGISFDLDLRMKTKSAGWLWVRIRGNAVEWDSAGRGTRSIGTLSDISEHRRADERLHLTYAALSAAANAIVIAGRDRIIRWVNPAFTAMTGFSAEEAVGHEIGALQSIDGESGLDSVIVETIEKGSPWQGETTSRRRDGSLHTEEMTITPLLDSEGTVTDFIVIKQDVTKRKQAEDLLRYNAFHDGLTGLPNRSLLLDRIQMAYLRFQRSNDEPFALLMVDLDHFKNVNDSLGHPCGDAVLLETARRLLRAVRTNDTVARLGGDEFAILLEDIAADDSPTRVAERILTALEEPFEVDGNLVEISASIGIVVATPAYKSTTEIFRDADIALYRAKGDGRANYQVFDQEMHNRVRERLELEANLRHAIDRGEMELYLQPVVSLASGRIHSFEALIRWHHSTRGMVPPAIFIPIAEETGLIVAVGTWVAREACRILREWPEGDPPPISINVSPAEILPRSVPTADAEPGRALPEEIDRKLARIVADAGIPSHLLKIEITEGVMIANPGYVANLLQQMVGKGFRLMLDDFGTGYSSLSYLQDLPFHQVKLDRAFTARLHAGNRSHELMRGIVTLAHNIGLEVIAEGVETEEQLALLRAADCDHVQGHLLSEPVPIAEAQLLYGAGKRW